MGDDAAGASLCEGAFEDGDADLDWCVDMSPSLCAMSTAELWSAAIDGKLGRDTRAWRIGLECWTRLEEIPEVAGAFDPPASESASETAVTPPAVEITSLPIPDVNAGEISSPAAAVSRREPFEGAAALEAEPLPWRHAMAGRLRGALIEARWIAAGCAIAAASVGLSIVSTAEPETRTVARASASAAVVRTLADAAAARVHARVPARTPARVLPAPRGGPNGAESGQRRLRAGRGRGHGR